MALTGRDIDRLIGVHPTLVTAITEILDAMAAAGHPMFVVQGVRTVAQQQALYARGRTTPPIGSKFIVTMKDGVTHRSNHQPHADGYGHAVDCAFSGVVNPFGDQMPWEDYGKRVEAAGLIWGGRWSHPHDSPHAELV